MSAPVIAALFMGAVLAWWIVYPTPDYDDWDRFVRNRYTPCRSCGAVADEPHASACPLAPSSAEGTP